MLHDTNMLTKTVGMTRAAPGRVHAGLKRDYEEKCSEGTEFLNCEHNIHNIYS